MHILIGLLTAIATLLYWLDRIGVDLAGLNPWSWRRRRNWRNQFQGDPIYSIEDPQQVAAILVIGTAKLGGDLSTEQKQTALQQFQTVFSLSANDATALLASSTHLLAAPQLLESQMANMMKRHRDTFTAEQIESLLPIIKAVSEAGGSINDEQRSVLAQFTELMAARQPQQGTWS